MKPPMVSSFIAKNIRETTKNFKKNHETRSQKKKNARFPFKTSLIAIFGLKLVFETSKN